MITGLAALNKSNRTDPGDDIRVGPGWRDLGRNGGKDKDQKPKRDVLPAFMPGQEQALAQQLNMGFGGGMGQWKDYLDTVYSPLPMRPFTPSMTPMGGDIRSGQPKIPPQNDMRNPNVPDVSGRNYHGDYHTGLVALRGRY